NPTELPLEIGVCDNDPANGLTVAPTRGFGGGLDDAMQICIGHRAVGIQPTHRTGGVDRLEDIHLVFLPVVLRDR
ncbi:MAG TPA: hypothetical protein VJT14_04765, partial [Candidatus Dormibacteraeota bacterium]|nr:hypothetical protein [Candidatus Dormibacteraeota bacterium]